MFHRRPTRAQRSRRAKSASRKPQRHRKFFVETLEDRRMMAIVSVTTTNDLNNGDTTSIATLIASNGGDGISLREAILATNNTLNSPVGVPDEIHFAIAGAGLQTIQPLTPLPTISDAVIIDGYTQAGASVNTNGDGLGLNSVLTIQLDGTSVGLLGDGLRLFAGSSGSTIRGLVINRFTDNGIEISGSNSNRIYGNYIGTNAAGDTDLGNAFDGVFVTGDSFNNRIGDIDVATRNLISGNGSDGIDVRGVDVDLTLITGNFIGTNRAGTAAIGNDVNGVFVRDGATQTTIGGLVANTRNIISGNLDDGIQVEGPSPIGTSITNNYIGLDVTGSAAVPNLDDGVVFSDGATNNIVGGTVARSRNIISGNGGEGVEFEDLGTSNNSALGNFIGTAADGFTDIGNVGDGVSVLDSASGNTIGGTNVDAANVIAFNNDGVSIIGAAAINNPIRRNSIFNNDFLGIDLDDNGFTPNDPNDPDNGGNRRQNFPVFAGNATLLGTSVSLTYRVDTAIANATYPLTVDFYLADSDNQEGRTYLATDTYSVAQAENDKSIVIPVPASLTNPRIVATATDAAGNTSEFSPFVLISGPVILGSEPTVIRANESITGGEVDEFQYIAHSTGKLVVRIDFIHALGDLNLEVRDRLGNLLAPIAMSSSPTQNFEQIIIPVVSQEPYFIRVLGNGLEIEQTVPYSLEVENFPAPVPAFVDLISTSDSGWSSNDNITSDTTPTFRIQADITNFIRNTSIVALDQAVIDPNNDGNPNDSTDDGAGVFVTLINQDTGAEVSGFATRVGSNNALWQFTPTNPLPEGEYFVSAAVQIVDGQQPQRMSGRAQLSDPITVVIDSQPPLGGTIDLLDYSDTGMFNTDNVTKINAPAFGGLGPVGTIVRVFAQANDAAGAPIGVPLIVGSGAVGAEQSDGNSENDLGVWEVTVEPMTDGKWNFFARFEDEAGNQSGPVSNSATKTNSTIQAIPNGGTITPPITLDPGDFPPVGNLPDTNVPILDVNVTVNITHTSDQDLDLILIAPDGTRIELSTDNGGTGNNYTFTIFDDSANILISNGVPPFTGAFRPEQPLSLLNNRNAIGTWQLEITDDSTNDFPGTFLSWSITIQSPLMVVIDTVAPNTPYLDLLDDTGRHSNDNTTKDDDPLFSMTTTDPNVAFSQLLFTDNFKFRVYDRFEGTQEVLIYDSATDALADASLTAGDMFTALTLLTRNLPTNGVFEDGVHNLKLEVEDRAGNISQDYLFELVVDTVTPPVSFGLPDADDATDGLAASSDSGVTTNPATFADRVTSDTTPTFWGQAEANSIVRLYLDANANGIIDLGSDVFLGQTTALPLDGNNAFPDGYWEITSIRDLNQLLGIPKDGLRRLLVTAQDVAGNPMAIVDDDGATISDGVGQLKIFIDTQGPQITGITVNDLTSDEYDLFDLKPTQQGPTPPVTSLKLAFRDLPSRVLDGILNDFLYPALAAEIAAALGNYRLVGDFNGVIPIDSIVVTNFNPEQINGNLSAVGSTSDITAAGLVGLATQPEVGDYISINSGPAAGQVRRIVGYNSNTGLMQLDIPLLNLPNIGNSFTIFKFATATVELQFAEPLPDDRYTLTVSDNLVDPANNKLDGESNASEPLEFPSFPTGDGVPGGKFVARFNIDSRPEIGVWAAGAVKIDTNGNFYFDPEALDAHNRDLSYTLGFSSDYIFAGNFSAVGGTADGFDKLAVYGRVGNQWRWLIDYSNDGIPDAAFNEASINGIPVAGNFDGNSANGDEVGIFTGSTWHFDRNHNYSVDTAFSTAYQGFPVVGDFDGDGDDDVATYVASSGGNTFYIDLNTAGAGNPISIDGIANYSFRVGLPGLASAGGYYGFPGIRERPVAADMNADGVDDLGLWVPDGTTLVPGDQGEWYFLLSNNDLRTPAVIENSIVDRAAVSNGFIPFNITPFGRDLYARFGNSFALPIVGNFDPPITVAQAKAIATTAAKTTTAVPTKPAQPATAVVIKPATTAVVAATAPKASTPAPTVSSSATTVAKSATTVARATVVAPATSTTTTTVTKKSSSQTSTQKSNVVVIAKTTPTTSVVAATAAPAAAVVASIVSPTPAPKVVAQAKVTQPAINQANVASAVVATTTTTKSKSSKSTTNKTVSVTANTQTSAVIPTTQSKPVATLSVPVAIAPVLATAPPVVVAPVSVAPATAKAAIATPKTTSQIVSQQTTTSVTRSNTSTALKSSVTVAQATPRIVAAKSPIVEIPVIVAQQPQIRTAAKSVSVFATQNSASSGSSSGVFLVGPSSDHITPPFAADTALQDPATADAALADLRLSLILVDEPVVNGKAAPEGYSNFDGWQEADSIADEVAHELASDALASAVS